MTESNRPKARSAQEVVAAIRAATESQVPGALEGLISGYHPIDIAYAMRELSSNERGAVFELLDAAASGVVLEEVDDEIGVDPAIASGPFVTTVNDAISLLIYLAIATSLLTLLQL